MLDYLKLIKVVLNAGLLYEMQNQERDEGWQSHNYEKWQAGNSGCVLSLWDQDVPNRLELKLIRYHFRK
jgi:hypothetical protein